MENLARGYLPTCRCFLSDHDFIHTPGTKLRAEGTHYCCSVDVSEKFFRIRICRQIEEGGEVCMDSALDAFVTKETEESQEQSCPPFSDSLVPYLKEKVEIQEELSAEPQKTEQETSKKFSTKTKKTIGEWNRIEKQFQFFHDLQSLWFTWCSLLERFAVEGSVFSYPSHTRPFKDHELFALYRWKKSLWELSDGDLEAHFDVSMSSNMTNPKSFLPEILDLIKRLMVCFRRAIRKSMETLEPLHLDTVFLKDVQTIIENLDTVPFLSSCLRSLNSFKVLQEMNEIFL